jgi:xylulokinase
VKALLMAADGTELGSGTAGYRVNTPQPGHAETDPADWWRATKAAVRQALTGHAPTSHPGAAWAPEAIAVVGQMHGLVLTDEHGAPLRPAILWPDRRATREAEDFVPDTAGNPPAAGMAGPILEWLRTHEPATIKQSTWTLPPKDWLRMQLTGIAATDPTDASGSLLHEQDLPPVLPSRAIAGRLREDPARELGLPPGIPVAVGAADTAAALLAAGLHEPGEALLVLGTGGQWIYPVSATAPPDATGRTNLFRAVGDGFYRLAGVQNVGLALSWVRETLGATWPELYATAAASSQSAPLFRPYLVPERYSNTGAAAWTGLTLSHTRQDLMRAALTGVAELLNENLGNLRATGAQPQQVVTAGGGSRDPAWRAMLSAAFGLPLREAPATSLTVRGAAMIAHYALQGEDKPQFARKETS